MKTLLAVFLCMFFTSCDSGPKKLSTKHPKVYKTTDKDGYCYYDNGLWYIYYSQPGGVYHYYGTSSSYTGYDASSSANWTPSSGNVSNFSDLPASEQQSVEGMSETSGESTGGSEAGGGSGSGGMSEGSGEASGGSSDGGSSDGGGDGGGGGE